MDLASLTPLDGGWSGETFLAEVAGERSVVRIYARPSHRGASAHEVDAALLRLVKGLLPVPEVLEVRRADDATGMPALLVTSFLPGERLEVLLPRLDDADKFPLAVANGLANIRNSPDLVTPKLGPLHVYQLVLPVPVPPPGSFDAQAAQRGGALVTLEQAKREFGRGDVGLAFVHGGGRISHRHPGNLSSG